LYLTKKIGTKEIKRTKTKRDLAASSQQAVIDVLIKKTIKATKDKKAKTIILGGGVAANHLLKKDFVSKIKKVGNELEFFVPPKILCTDNAIMIAIAGYFNRQKKITPKTFYKLKAKSNLNF
jgi:N6-L-threonylcarbamoyladenine synthase